MQNVDEIRVLLGCMLFLLYTSFVIYGWGNSKSFKEGAIDKDGNVKYSRILTFIIALWLYPRISLHYCIEWMYERDYILDSIALVGVAIINTVLHLLQYYSVNARPKRKELEEAAKVYKEIWNCGGIIFGLLLVIYALIPSASIEDAQIADKIIRFAFGVHKTAGLLYNLFTTDKYKSIPKAISERYEFILMSSTESQAYCRYKNKKRMEIEMIYIIGTCVWCFCMFGVMPDFLGGVQCRLMQGVCAVVFLYVLFKILPQKLKHNIKNKEAVETVCECVRVSLKMNKCIGLVCTDKHEVVFDSKLEEGDSVLIYVPSLDKVFKEKIKNIESIITIPQNENPINVEKKVETINVYRLSQMSLEDSKKYCEYKFKDILEIYIVIICIVGIIFFIVMPVICDMLKMNASLKWGFMGIIVVAVIFFNIKIIIPKIQYERKIIKESVGTAYEYVKIKGERYQKVKLISIEGREIYYDVYSDDEMVLIYVPVLNKVYDESVLAAIEPYITIPHKISQPIKEYVSTETGDECGVICQNCDIEDTQKCEMEFQNTSEFLQKMTMTETDVYQIYRYEKDKKQRNMMLGIAISSLSVMSILCLVGTESFNTAFISIMIVVLAVIMSVFFILSQIQLNKLKDSTEIPYEYTMQNVILNKERELVREDGEKIAYKLKSDRGKRFAENEEVVVIYIPQCKKVCVEKKKDWERLFTE